MIPNNTKPKTQNTGKKHTNIVNLSIRLLFGIDLRRKSGFINGSGNEGKGNTALYNEPYCDTNTALFSSHTLTRHIWERIWGKGPIGNFPHHEL